MAYTKTVWINGGTPAINATNLNKMEDGIESANNPEYSTTATSYAEITAIPSTAQSLMDEFEVNGQTTTNLLPDAVAGLESLTSWSGTSTATLDSNNELEGTNCFKLTLSSTEQYEQYNILSLLDLTKYYLISVYIKNVDATNGLGIGLYNPDTFVSVVSSYDTSTTYKRVGIIVDSTVLTGATTALQLQLRIKGASAQYGYFDALAVQEISAADYALGATASMDKYSWHLGTQSVDKMRVLVEGKNIFDKSRTVLFKSLDGSGVSQTSTTGHHSDYIKIDSSTQYTIQGRTQTTIAFYTANKTYISSSAGVQTFTTPANATYLRFNIAIADELDLIQLEQSATATTYVPYNKTQAVCHLPIRKVPAISDIWNVLDGVHTQNVERYVLQSADIDSVADGTNLQRVVIGLNAFSGIKTQTVSTIDLGTLVTGLIEETDSYDTVGDANKWYTDATNLYILVALGTYADVATARTALTSTVTTIVDYQLSTPITTYLQPSILSSSASGRIIQERFVEDYDYYNSGLALTDTDYLITNLVEVRKWDIATGTYAIIPTANVTVTAGEITAITDALPGEFYTFDFNYDSSLSVNAELEYSYPVNMAGQVSANTQAIQNLNNKVDDIEVIVDKNTTDINYLVDNTRKYGESSVGTDTYAISTSNPYSAYNAGLIVSFKADVSNTGASSGNLDGLGAKAIKVIASSGKVDTKTGDMIAGGIYNLIYDGTDLILTNPNSLLQSTVTAQGDTLYASGANTITRLAKGTAGQSLKMNSGATAPEWVSGAWELIESYSNTEFSSKTFSSISSGYSQFCIVANVASTNTISNDHLNLRFNVDSGSNYEYYNIEGTSIGSIVVDSSVSTTLIQLGRLNIPASAPYPKTSMIVYLTDITSEYTGVTMPASYNIQLNERFDATGAWKSIDKISSVECFAISYTMSGIISLYGRR